MCNIIRTSSDSDDGSAGSGSDWQPEMTSNMEREKKDEPSEDDYLCISV